MVRKKLENINYCNCEKIVRHLKKKIGSCRRMTKKKVKSNQILCNLKFDLQITILKFICFVALGKIVNLFMEIICLILNSIFAGGRQTLLRFYLESVTFFCCKNKLRNWSSLVELGSVHLLCSFTADNDDDDYVVFFDHFRTSSWNVYFRQSIDEDQFFCLPKGKFLVQFAFDLGSKFHSHVQYTFN